MADPIVPDATATFARAIGPEPDDIVREMEQRAADEEFPIVGSEVGGWLAMLVHLREARSVFEFGSGFGYSAYWFARALPAFGDVILTEMDAGELETAREFLSRGGVADKATFEHGDALEIVERYDGPFDVVLLDHQKRRYREAFEAVSGAVPVGGVVVADNAMTAGTVDFEALSAIVTDEADAETLGALDERVADATRGVADYLERVRSDGDFETALLPLGEGVAVSVRTG
jgi:predicted O-methyltransferase YrrM